MKPTTDEVLAWAREAGFETDQLRERIRALGNDDVPEADFGNMGNGK